MQAHDVLSLYRAVTEAGVAIWIDGGWCVDALLGRQTRDHSDLDLAVQRDQADRLREILATLGYLPDPKPDDTLWNYVLTGPDSRSVDIHVVEYDSAGAVSYGIPYPFGSLTGTGHIDGTPVACVDPEWMFRFKTSYPPEDKDRHDVAALAAAFGFPLPEPYR
ncbi:nucleotidyltransferase domain-containing protein [Nocardia stercoris]|uniref:Aminoglycoside nucleotidyltransferase n=1 Tax=Nocardia stercoris TaxID=2483361 RepID=A0A3M2L955_9NOCA|nr:aminoglycoside nucleotidyltransferase [Nocardia stercoris]RMI34161.1 aminoglycoside nucleotidyltransferase [Nocardia stercoris]